MSGRSTRSKANIDWKEEYPQEFRDVLFGALRYDEDERMELDEIVWRLGRLIDAENRLISSRQ